MVKHFLSSIGAGRQWRVFFNFFFVVVVKNDFLLRILYPVKPLCMRLECRLSKKKKDMHNQKAFKLSKNVSLKLSREFNRIFWMSPRTEGHSVTRKSEKDTDFCW